MVRLGEERGKRGAVEVVHPGQIDHEPVTREDGVWISEIMIVPELRGKGLGTAILLDVIAAAGDRPVRLTVSAFNTAAERLYKRVGFRRVDGDESQHVMEYRR